jgi:enoyl-CoA hydratase
MAANGGVMITEQETVFGTQGKLATILLNRPKALNALSPTQFQTLDDRLRQWDDDDSVAVVLIEGAGGKAFCAGGDIKAVWEGRKRGDEAGNRALFRHEYRMDRRIHHYCKPYVALLDGIVMGGGAGASINGRFRVATERSLFAMPETAIGFFPDVGATHFLSRCPGALGLYLGMSAARLGPGEMLAAGLATHFVPSASLDSLKLDLAKAALSNDPTGAVEAALARHHQPQPSGRLPAIMKIADHAAKADRAVDYVRRIIESQDENATAMSAASPTSLAVTFKQLTQGRSLSFDDAIKREFRLASTFLMGTEFHEGIRALVIDKDKNPAWNPSRLEDVTAERVNGLFAGDNEELMFP